MKWLKLVIILSKNIHGQNHFLIVHQHYVCFFLNIILNKSSVVGKVVDNWIRTEFNRRSRAKCLILIGGTGTGKTTFAKSLPGQYNYFQGRWRLDSWKDSARYLIFDDIPWDKFDQLGFPPKKALLTQNGLTMVCTPY